MNSRKKQDFNLMMKNMVIVEKGKAKSLKLAIRELSYKIPNIRTIAQWNEVLDIAETSKMEKHLRKILGY
jgi:hypothetical protein